MAALCRTSGPTDSRCAGAAGTSCGLSTGVLGRLPASCSPSESVSTADPSTAGRARRFDGRRLGLVVVGSPGSNLSPSDGGVSHASVVVAALEHDTVVSSVTRLVLDADDEQDEALVELNVCSPVEVDVGSGGSGLPSWRGAGTPLKEKYAGVGSDDDRCLTRRGGTGSIARRGSAVWGGRGGGEEGEPRSRLGEACPTGRPTGVVSDRSSSSGSSAAAAASVARSSSTRIVSWDLEAAGREAADDEPDDDDDEEGPAWLIHGLEAASGGEKAKPE